MFSSLPPSFLVHSSSILSPFLLPTFQLHSSISASSPSLHPSLSLTCLVIFPLHPLLISFACPWFRVYRPCVCQSVCLYPSVSLSFMSPRVFFVVSLPLRFSLTHLINRHSLSSFNKPTFSLLF